VYETGDHAVTYAASLPCVVDAYLECLDSKGAPPGWADRIYVPPAGTRLPIALWQDAPPLTFRQILTYCTELGQAPSPGAHAQPCFRIVASLLI
jgi:hypothetical protein